MAGFYGKLPSKGDFLTRGLQRTVVDNLHNLFQQGLQESRAKLGEDWLDYYAIAPIWHFYFPKGVLDDNCWLGIWSPSVDSVNRSFPLVMLDTIEQPLSDIADFNAYLDWFTECENLMLDVVHGDIEFDQFCSLITSKRCYQKFHSSDDIDAIFDDIKSSEPAQKSEVNIDHLVPSTPFEKALLSKIGMLEFVLSKVCETQNVDYQSVVDEFIGGLSDEQKDSSMNVVGPKSLDFGVNLANAAHLFDAPNTGQLVADSCIWSSDGNEKVPQQLVMHAQLPSPEEFHKFLQGF